MAVDQSTSSVTDRIKNIPVGYRLAGVLAAGAGAALFAPALGIVGPVSLALVGPAATKGIVLVKATNWALAGFGLAVRNYAVSQAPDVVKTVRDGFAKKAGEHLATELKQTVSGEASHKPTIAMPVKQPERYRCARTDDRPSLNRPRPKQTRARRDPNRA